MLSKGKGKIQLSGDQIQPARFSGPNKIDCLLPGKIGNAGNNGVHSDND
jgi:hypothetical protein